jgi:anti-sigma B factor antagonist
MSLIVRAHGNVRILTMTGEFTLGEAGLARPLDLRGRPLSDLSDALANLVAQSPQAILLDMTGVTFLDSAALGDLIAWKKRAVLRGSDIALLNPTGRVRAIIEMLSLDRVFKVFDDEGEALRAFGA